MILDSKDIHSFTKSIMIEQFGCFKALNKIRNSGLSILILHVEIVTVVFVKVTDT